jgi:hypothetical protein
MPIRKPDADAAEVGMRSIKELLDHDGSAAAEFALDFLAPSIESLMDEGQATRLRAVRIVLARSPDLAMDGSAEEAIPSTVVPFGRR